MWMCRSLLCIHLEMQVYRIRDPQNKQWHPFISHKRTTQHTHTYHQRVSYKSEYKKKKWTKERLLQVPNETNPRAERDSYISKTRPTKKSTYQSSCTSDIREDCDNRVQYILQKRPENVTTETTKGTHILNLLRVWHLRRLWHVHIAK